MPRNLRLRTESEKETQLSDLQCSISARCSRPGSVSLFKKKKKKSSSLGMLSPLTTSYDVAKARGRH